MLKIGRILKQNKLKVAVKSENKLQQLANNKNKVKKIDNNGVSKLECNKCDACYVGETGPKNKCSNSKCSIPAHARVSGSSTLLNVKGA